MKYKVERAQEVRDDLDRIFDFLTASYVRFGDDLESAMDRAGARLARLEAVFDDLCNRPHRGTLHNELLAGLRSTTVDRAVIYFDIDESKRVVRVLAVYFGGQDHRRHIVGRLPS